jgi:hypothetical protein
MQEIVKQHAIEVDKKVVGGVELRRTLILYNTVDADYFVLSVKPLESLEKTALTKTRVSVTAQQDKHLIKLPAKVYNFYQMADSDYTVMASKMILLQSNARFCAHFLIFQTLKRSLPLLQESTQVHEDNPVLYSKF